MLLKKLIKNCPKKLENILNLADKYGLSHVETAKYYGTSEVQLGMGFKNIEKIPNKCKN